jgi:lipopolysaccharide biosynthesis protein
MTSDAIGRLTETGIFDREWYLAQNADVAASGCDPLEHYLVHGAAEGRNPSPMFDTNWYLAQNPDVAASGLNPAVHYALYGAAEGRTARPKQSAEERRRADYVPRRPQQLPSELGVKLIAFYLPQFHPIPENDAFWGKGFTEWVNVAGAVPQFEGHYQPRLPGELGFYDLRVPEIQEAQIEMAKDYGLHAFCFHFYWFGGKRLLEMPLQRFAANRKHEFHFCLNWANENWTRRWDGRDNEILIAQQHSGNDDLALIEHWSQYARDHRYLRVQDRPLFVVYRPELLPSPRATADRWREWCRKNGLGEIFLACTQSFKVQDPADFNFDAAIEFPPNLGHFRFEGSVGPLHPSFRGRLCDWTRHVELSRHYAATPQMLFRCVCPSWDNTARRGCDATILLNSSPALYEEWLLNAASDTRKRFPDRDRRLVFINAWNEWAEGAYLEPDARYGYAYLEATANALRLLASGPTR